MVKVWVLFLFVAAGQPMAEIGEYPTIKDCQDAVDTSAVKSAADDAGQHGAYSWREPFQAQWACVWRPARDGGRAARVGRGE